MRVSYLFFETMTPQISKLQENLKKEKKIVDVLVKKENIELILTEAAVENEKKNTDL